MTSAEARKEVLMKKNIEDMDQKEFDEFDAIEYIRTHVDDELAMKYSDDDLLLLIDTIGDYFDTRKSDKDFSCTDDAIVKYVEAQLKKDAGNAVEPADVAPLVLAELDYEDTID